MQGFPISDWQFWLATLVALLALLFLLRNPLRRLLRRGRPRARSHKAALTIEGAPVDSPKRQR